MRKVFVVPIFLTVSLVVASLTGFSQQEKKVGTSQLRSQQKVADTITLCFDYQSGQLIFFREGETPSRTPCEPPKPGVIFYKCDSKTNKCTSSGVKDSIVLYDAWKTGKVGKGSGFSCDDDGCTTGWR